MSTYVTHPKQLKIILGALMMTMLLAALDQTIVSTALPTITSDPAASTSCPGSSPPIC